MGKELPGALSSRPFPTVHPSLWLALAETSTPVRPGWLDSGSWSRGSYIGCCAVKDSPDFQNLINCTYLWLHRVFAAARGLPLVAVSGGYSSLRSMGFSLRWLFLLQSMGFTSCGSQALERGLSS